MSAGWGAALESFGGSLMKLGEQREEGAERERLSREADRRAMERFLLTYKLDALVDARERTRTIIGEDGRAYTIREEQSVNFNDADPGKSTATWNEVERTQNPIPAPRTRTATVGDSNVGKQWNDKEGTWDEIPGERSPRYRSNTPGLLADRPRVGYDAEGRHVTYNPRTSEIVSVKDADGKSIPLAGNSRRRTERDPGLLGSESADRRAASDDKPPEGYPDAQRSPRDGEWYVKRNGRWHRVDP